MMTADSVYYQEKIQAYLEGKLPAEEEKELFVWANRTPENFTLFKSYITENQYSERVSQMAEKAWEHFLEYREKHISEKSAINYLSRWSKVAAMLLVALLLGFFAAYYGLHKQVETSFSELKVPFGEQKQVRLSDGTEIWLNSGTLLRYPATFKGNLRTVELNGEGYFNVSKEKNIPFIVKTADFKVEVLGTTFNLSAYGNDDKAILELESGMVELISNFNSEKLKLSPGETATFNKQRKTFQTGRIKKTEIASWRGDTLTIRNKSMYEVSKILERKFNVTIEIKSDLLKQCMFSGRFSSKDGLDNILELFELTVPMKYKRIYRGNAEIIVIEKKEESK